MGRKDFLQETRGAFKLALVSHRGSKDLQVLFVKLQPFFKRATALQAAACYVHAVAVGGCSAAHLPSTNAGAGGGATAPAAGAEISCRAAFWGLAGRRQLDDFLK